jgi:hypothetical protein
MPKATPIPITSRRATLASSAAALLSAAVGFAKPAPLPWRNGPRPAPTPGDDTALIADCQAFIAWEHRVVGLYSGPGKIEEGAERDAAENGLQVHQRPLLDRICTTPAMTPAGSRAKATALATWAPDHLKPGPYWDERLLASLLEDLTGRTAA